MTTKNNDMSMSMIHHVLSPDEMTGILNHPIVKINKDKLSNATKVNFFVELPETIKTKLATALNLDLTHLTSIPLRWLKGDTAPHTDRGEKIFTPFNI